MTRKEYKGDNFIFDLAGGAVSSTKFPEASEKVRKIVKSKSIIIGLLPCKDKEKSIKHLFTRERRRAHFKEMNKHTLLEKTKKSYVKFPKIFKDICDVIIYTENRNPNSIAQEIVTALKTSKS